MNADRRIALVSGSRPTQFARAVEEHLRAAGYDVSYAIAASARTSLLSRLVTALGGSWLRPTFCEPVDEAAWSAPVWIDLREPAAGVIGRLAPHRVLRLDVGASTYANAGFAEAQSGAATVQVQLIASEGGRAFIVADGRFAYASSYGRTLDLVLRECVPLFAHGLRAPIGRRAGARSRAIRPVGAAAFARFAFQETWRRLRVAFRYAFEDVTWRVGVVERSLDNFLRDPRAAKVELIGEPGHALADPFFFATPTKTEVLCERIDASGRGEIVAIDVRQPHDEHPVRFAGSGHVSYPYVFSDGQNQYVMAERSDKRSLELCRINGDAAVHVATLIDDRAVVDPTMLRYDGRWWLFFTDAARLPNAVLHLYWADSLEGPWRPHASDPVKIDIGSARPAGTPFERNDILYRPAQDCIGRYGSAVVINRIDRLDPQTYEERPVARIEPKSLGLHGYSGIHTLSATDTHVAVDLQIMRRSLRKSLRLFTALRQARAAERTESTQLRDARDRSGSGAASGDRFVVER